jgi:hypothetical protein
MKRCVMFSLVTLGGLMFCGQGWSQVAAQPVPPGAPNVMLQTAPQNVPLVPMYYPSTGTRTYALSAAPGTAAQSEVAQLVKQLEDAEDSAKKVEITKKLETAVGKAFDQDMETRESDLTKLDERVKKLRGQLDRRRKAKEDIIQLQIKVLVNEAEGLGFGGPRPVVRSVYGEGQRALPSTTPRPASSTPER